MADLLANQSKLEFVRQQLSQYAGEKRESSDRVMILCPYHSESTPSGSINVGVRYAPGYFSCFACGAKANWDKLAPRINLQPYKRGKPEEEHAVDLLMTRGLAALEAGASDKRYREDKFKFWKLPKGKLWRTIPTNLLIQLQGQVCYRWFEEYQNWGSEKFIHFPVVINGEKEGFFVARLKKDASGEKPSYLLAAKAENSDGWSRTHGLWPFDHSIELMRERKSSTIVLVEGQRDALRLLMNDIPAMCIFGTQSWSENKAKLLEIAGVERVVSLFDGDDAGIHATDYIVPQLRKLFEVRIIKLWKIKGSPYIQFKDKKEPSKAAKKAGITLWDPCSCPQWIINKINDLYFN